MKGRAYMGEVLIQIQLESIHEEMSELLDKQVNVQKESLKKTSGDSRKLPQAHEKVCNENESRRMNQFPLFPIAQNEQKKMTAT